LVLLLKIVFIPKSVFTLGEGLLGLAFVFVGDIVTDLPLAILFLYPIQIRELYVSGAVAVSSTSWSASAIPETVHVIAIMASISAIRTFQPFTEMCLLEVIAFYDMPI